MQSTNNPVDLVHFFEEVQMQKMDKKIRNKKDAHAGNYSIIKFQPHYAKDLKG